MNGDMRSVAVIFSSCLAVAACGDGASSDGGGDGFSGGAATGGSSDGSGNADGDCLTDGEEAEIGTNPTSIDSDGDAVSDCDELACVSDPIDGAETCYTCGWKHNDPGTLVSTGATEGSVIANVDLIDQCGETVPLWDLAGEYHILFLTAAW
jgi:hypothetical protein